MNDDAGEVSAVPLSVPGGQYWRIFCSHAYRCELDQYAVEEVPSVGRLHKMPLSALPLNVRMSPPTILPTLSNLTLLSCGVGVCFLLPLSVNSIPPWTNCFL